MPTKVAAIIPAYNEAKTIAGVVKPVIANKQVDEVIVVSDGSTDRTAELARLAGATVYKPAQRLGKGGAMKHGVSKTDADVILFLDADLLGLTSEHVSQILKPVISGQAVMGVGLRDRWGWWMKNLPKVDPLGVIGGERALKREIFEAIPDDKLKGFMIETSLNYYCRRKKLSVAYVFLTGLNMVIKEKKMGLMRGFIARLKMSFEVLRIRLKLYFGSQDWWR